MSHFCGFFLMMLMVFVVFFVPGYLIALWLFGDLR